MTDVSPMRQNISQFSIFYLFSKTRECGNIEGNMFIHIQSESEMRGAWHQDVVSLAQHNDWKHCQLAWLWTTCNNILRCLLKVGKGALQFWTPLILARKTTEISQKDSKQRISNSTLTSYLWIYWGFLDHT